MTSLEHVMFTRKAVALLTGIPETRLATLMRRDQLPITRDPEADRMDLIAIAETGRSWTRFNTHDVVAIAVAEAFSRRAGLTTGLGPDAAAALASNLRGEVTVGASAHTEDRYAGYVSQAVEPLAIDGGFFVFGSFTEIASKVRIASKSPPRPSRVILVNVDEIIREIRIRATNFSMDFDPGAR
jgi:hypothetical protein